MKEKVYRHEVRAEHPDPMKILREWIPLREWVVMNLWYCCRPSKRQTMR